jgi:hypothetical protein
LALMLLAAASAGAAPAWLAPVDLSVAGQSVFVPQVAFDAQGNAVAVWGRSNGTNSIVQGAVRPAGGSWQAPVDLSAAGQNAYYPQVAFDAQGNAVAVWSRYDGVNYIVQGAVRPAASGVWEAPADLSAAGQSASGAQVAVDAQGNALAVWHRYSGSNWIVQGAVRPAGGAWQAPVDLAVGASAPQVAVDAQGNAVAVWERCNGTDCMVQGAVRAAGGAWQAPVDLSLAGQSVLDPQVAVDAQGNTVAVWSRSDGTDYIVQGAVRPAASGVWQAPVDLSGAGQSAVAAQVAVDAQGDTVAVWQRANGTDYIVQGAVRAAGGAWQAPVDLSAAGPSTSGPQVAFDAQGNAVAVWTRFNGANFIVQGAVRAATGAWQAPVDLSAAGRNADFAQVAFDAQGNAVAVWQRYDGAEWIAQGAGYDAAGPLLQALSIPTTGTAGQPLSLSVAPLDVWSGLTTSWSFGDGASARMTSATHSYAVPGSYNLAVTSTDALDNTTTATRTITITPAPGSSPALAAVSGLRVAPAKFRAARSGASATTAAVRTATRVSYTLTVAASARFTVQRATSGRTVSGRCAKPTAGNRTHKRCTRFVAVRGSFTRTRPAGADRFTFTGRLGGHALRPGRYRLVATPAANGHTGKPRRAGFRIVK